MFFKFLVGRKKQGGMKGDIFYIAQLAFPTTPPTLPRFDILTRIVRKADLVDIIYQYRDFIEEL